MNVQIPARDSFRKRAAALPGAEDSDRTRDVIKDRGKTTDSTIAISNIAPDRLIPKSGAMFQAALLPFGTEAESGAGSTTWIASAVVTYDPVRSGSPRKDS